MGKDGSWSQSASTTSTETSSPTAPLSPSELADGDRAQRHASLQRAPLLHQSTVGSSAEDDEYDPSGQACLGGNSFQLASTAVEVSGGEVVDIEMVDYSYVKLAKTCITPKHDYTYPIVDGPSPPIRAEPSLSVESSHASVDCVAQAVMLPARKPRRSRSATRDIFRRSTTLSSERPLVSAMRSRCVHCHEMFSHDSNRAGVCVDAPDRTRRVIDRVSCLCCARAVVYHCDVSRGGSADDWRGDDEPCTNCDPSAPGCCKRWTLLAALSLVVPCLWCYLPLNACHHCGVRWCGRCGGGRHKAA